MFLEYIAYLRSSIGVPTGSVLGPGRAVLVLGPAPVVVVSTGSVRTGRSAGAENRSGAYRWGGTISVSAPVGGASPPVKGSGVSLKEERVE